MFRPSTGQESAHGGPRASFPGPPARPGLQNPNQFPSSFGMHGRGSPGPGPGPGPPQQFPGSPYPGYHPGPPLPPPPLPPPPPGNFPADPLPPPPPYAQGLPDQRPAEEAPSMPRDPEMLKNIDVLSSFVVKNGPQFEDMARKKEARDPKFGFLFGGEPGSEAAIGRAYYEWKKSALMATLRPQPQNSSFAENFSSPLTNDAPTSPGASDMDMEDDFEEPSPASERNMDQLKDFKTIPGTAPQEPEVNPRPQGAQDPRVPTPLTMNQGNLTAVPQAVVPQRPQIDTALSELPRRKDTRRRTGFDRPCMEDVTPGSSPPRQTTSSAPLEREHPLVGNGRTRSTSRVSRWGPSEPSSQELPERAASSLGDTLGSSKSSENHSDRDFERPDRDFEKPKHSERPDETQLEDRLEAVTPLRDDESDSDIKVNPGYMDKSPRLDERLPRGSSARDHVRRKVSPAGSDDSRPRDSSLDDRRSRDSPQISDRWRRRDRSPEVATKQQKSISGSDAGAKVPTVDEFGRAVRQGGSDSDAEDSQYHRKRRRSPSGSRSRSRSPSDSRRRRRSRSRSPRRRGRRSRTHSRSPRHKGSLSRSSPPRDSRRGGDGGRGGDRGYQDRGGDRGGRRGGRGGAPPACLDFARGRCFRGSSCRFLHAENSNSNGSSGDSRFERAEGRGGRGNRRDDVDEGGRGYSGGSRSGWGEEPSRGRGRWEPTNDKDKDYNEERHRPLEESEREQPQTSPVSEYGDEPAGRPSERRDEETKGKQLHTESHKIDSLPPPPQAPFPGNSAGLLHISQLPPPPPIGSLPPSQVFLPPAGSTQQSSYGMSFTPPMSQSGFSVNVPPPPPPPPQGYQGHLSSVQLQPPYMGSTTQQPGYPATSAGLPQVGGQLLAPLSRPGSAWPPAPASTPTSAPTSMAYSGLPMQVSTPQPSYGFTPPPSQRTSYTGNVPQYQFPQHLSQASKPDGLEPGPPGAGEAGKKLGSGSAPSVSRHTVEHWKGSTGGNGASTHIGDVGMVILESVSPGLPGHHHMENVSPGPHAGLVMESISPAGIAQNTKTLLSGQQQGTGLSNFGSSQPDNPGVASLENVSPAPEGNWSPAGGGEMKKGSSDRKRDKEKKRDKEEHKVRGLTLLRTAVAEHVKDVLKPTWREGHMSKEAFKTIAKKAVDKVLEAIKPHQVPKTDEKVAHYMENARPKISKLVQGYVDKYVKT